MIRARLLLNVAMLPLPVPLRVINTVLLACLACAAATFWMALQP